MNAGLSSQMAKPNKMSRGVTYGALSDAEKNRLKNNQSRAKNVYPSTAWLVAKWAKVAASKIASWAKKVASGVSKMASRATKSVYPSVPWVAASAGRAAARWIKNAASKAKKPVYWALSQKEAAKLWGVAKAGAALWWVGKLASKWAAKVWSAVKSAAKWAVKAQSVKNATRLQNKPQLKKAEPYYDLRTKSTKWSKDARIGELPRKAKRK